MKVKIINPDARLLPEMSATASFLQNERSEAELREPPRIWLPSTALSDGRVAIVDARNKIVWRRVNTGAVREDRVEITSGVRSGDRVVTENPDRLKEGQLVRHGE